MRRAGVTVGLPLRRALALCRDATVLPPRATLYGETVAALLNALEELSPRVEREGGEAAPPTGDLCLFLDLSGMTRLWPRERNLAEAIAAAARAACRLSPAVGVADGRPAARAAAFRALQAGCRAAGRQGATTRATWSDTPSANQRNNAPASTPAAPAEPPPLIQIIPPGETPAFLAPLPLEAVALSAELRERLHLLGLRTIGALAAQFGRPGIELWERAQGIDRAPFVVRPRPVAISDQIDLPAPSADQEAILIAARILLRRLLRRPEARGRLVRRMEVDAHFIREAGSGRAAREAVGNRQRAGGEARQIDGRGSGETRQLPTAYCLLPRAVFRDPTADPERMLALLRQALERAALPGPVERLSITLSEFCGEHGQQLGLFAEKGRREAQLAEALRPLRLRYNRPLVLRLAPLEPWSRIPERRLALTPC